MSVAAPVEEADLRMRICAAARAIPEWSWTVDELRALATLLDSLVAGRRRVDAVGNVVWLADRR